MGNRMNRTPSLRQAHTGRYRYNAKVDALRWRAAPTAKVAKATPPVLAMSPEERRRWADALAKVYGKPKKSGG